MRREKGAFLKTLWIEKTLDYDGSQLRPLFAYESFGILGSSAVAFRGACDISFAEMKDLEDVRDQSAIQGSDMIHFIVEIFDSSLWGAVAFQRLLASLVGDTIKDLSQGKWLLDRQGDDLYTLDRRKFSISIASKSYVSVMIHFAVNVSNEGTPVSTSCLKDFEIDPLHFAKVVLANLAREYQGTLEATQKVRPL